MFKVASPPLVPSSVQVPRRPASFYAYARIIATTDDGGGKAGDGDYEEDRSGLLVDPSTPEPETSAVMRECGHKTGEKGGGREEAGPGKGTY